jgi:hypothetical protein
MNTTLRILGTVVAVQGSYFSCTYGTAPYAYATMHGHAFRGPTIVGCDPYAPCMNAGFSVGFTVLQNDRQVARFRSGADGAFSVDVPIGKLTIVPDSDAPIQTPKAQQKRIEVPSDGLSDLVLRFDTGIR